MLTKWLNEHVSEIADSLMSRINREGVSRRWLLVYHESIAGVRGGLAVIPEDDAMPKGWLPVAGVLSKACAMTRDQVRAKIHDAAYHLPVLDPEEELNCELTASGEQFVIPGCEIKPTPEKPQGNLW